MQHLLFSNEPGNWRGVDFPKLSLTRISWDNAPDNPIAFVFFGHINVDFDGSSTAYGPPGLTPLPDDDLSNAGDNVKGWYGVAAAAAGDPLVQDGTILIDKKPSLLKKGKYPIIQQAKNDDPNPGYYVSSTPHPLGPYYRQDSYIDASQVPFGALSGKLKTLASIWETMVSPSATIKVCNVRSTSWTAARIPTLWVSVLTKWVRDWAAAAG